ncbi:MAG: hypothetical protein ABWZ18_09285, partial [Solirubrobacterales bacterium]
MTLIPFVQLEFAGLIGLPEGRYLAREEAGDRVLIVQGFGVPKPPGRLQRPSRPIDPDEDESVPVSRVTVALPERFEAEAEAERWLQATAGDAERRSAEVRAATRLLNRALNALRAGARDPLVQDVGATRALAIRVGFGDGDEIAEGRWREARELARPRPGRLDDVDPQERVAAVLSGREAVHPAETLLERARLDIQQGRVEEARYGLRAAREALAELPDERPAKL